MAIPQNILDALDGLEADTADATAKEGANVVAQQAKVDAIHAADLAATAVTASHEKTNTDRAALITLINNTYPPG